MDTPLPLERGLEKDTPEPVEKKTERRRVRFLQAEPSSVVVIKPRLKRPRTKGMPLMTMIKASEKVVARKLWKDCKWTPRQVIHGWWN